MSDFTTIGVDPLLGIKLIIKSRYARLSVSLAILTWDLSVKRKTNHLINNGLCI